MKKTVIFLTIILAGFFVKAQNSTGLSEINKEDLLANVKILTSPDFDGRLSGSGGYNKAAQYVAKQIF